MGLTRAQAESLGIGHLYPIENDADVLCRLGSGPIDRLAGRIPSKYNAVRTQYTGVWYASKAEAKRAAHLDAMVTGGTVRFWMRRTMEPAISVSSCLRNCSRSNKRPNGFSIQSWSPSPRFRCWWAELES